MKVDFMQFLCTLYGGRLDRSGPNPSCTFTLFSVQLTSFTAFIHPMCIYTQYGARKSCIETAYN